MLVSVLGFRAIGMEHGGADMLAVGSICLSKFVTFGNVTLPTDGVY